MDQIGKRGKPGGIFECDSCGTEYSTEWARAKIQEIKGTVKVEGTVEVKGTVKLDGPVKVEGATTKENLVKRAKMKLENAYIPQDGSWWMGNDQDYNEIKALLEQALVIDPEYAEAYLYMAVMKNHSHTVEEFRKKYISSQGSSQSFDQFCRFARGDMAILAEDIQKDYAAEPARQAKRREEEKQKRQEEAKRKAENCEKLRLVREKNEKAQCLLAMDKYSVLYGLKTDGTVVFTHKAVWIPKDEQNKINAWDEIVQIAVTDSVVVGLRSDGTVLAVGENKNGRCAVGDWKDITAIATSGSHTVGLRRDGMVVAVGKNEEEQCNVSGWKDIIAVAVGYQNTAGLRSDGTVVVTGKNEKVRNVVNDWSNIVSIAADSQTIAMGADGMVRGTEGIGSGWYRRNEQAVVAAAAVGLRCVYLRADGTVGTADWLSENEHGECDVDGWQDIVAVAAGKYHTVGLRADGTVAAVGENKNGQCNVSGWTDIVAIAADDFCTVGLRSDGTVVTTDTKHDLSTWKLFGSLDTVEQEQQAMKHLAAERRAKALSFL